MPVSAQSRPRQARFIEHHRHHTLSWPGQELADTLASIRSQQTAAALQVVVVDGSDTPVPPQLVAPFELVREQPANAPSTWG